MIRRFLATAASLALLAGLIAAPHTHLHPSERGVANDSPRAHAVLHSHVTSHEGEHEHDAPADADPGDGVSVDAFVFAPAKINGLTDTVVVPPQAIVPPRMVSVWTNIRPQTPPDYGSPPNRGFSSRAPPSLPLRAI